MGEGAANRGPDFAGTYPILNSALPLIATTVVLVLIGLLLRKRGLLRSPAAGLGWALLSGIPLLISIAHAYSMGLLG